MGARKGLVPNDTRNEESGRYAEKYPDEAFLDVLAESDGAGTQEIADTVGCSHKTALDKLRALEEDGAVESQRVGNALWWSLSGEDR